jgi:RNA polymerase sigma factor (TIGR02999 family)
MSRSDAAQHDPHLGVTRLLHAAARGEQQAVTDLLPLVYDQLRALAQRRLQSERAGHTLEATALVHEAYIKLVGHERIDWKGRGHFYVAAADAMRKILVDHARKRGAHKRGADWRRVALTMEELATGEHLDELLALDDALEALRAEDEQAAQVVQLRFFAGLSVDETAESLGLSARTVDREWAFARAWLQQRLLAEAGPDSGGGAVDE